MNLYLIPGLGADERLFRNLDLPGNEIHPIRWIKPLKNETLASYAGRLSEQVDTSVPFALGGVSFGGILCVEMAKIVPAQKILIISSVKQSAEISALGALLRTLPLYRMFPKYVLVRLDPMLKFFFGARNREELQLLKEMLGKTDKAFIDWAIHGIVNWKNTEPPPHYLQLKGTIDRLMLGTRVNDCTLIKGGTHLMVMQESEKISKIICDYLSD